MDAIRRNYDAYITVLKFVEIHDLEQKRQTKEILTYPDIPSHSMADRAILYVQMIERMYSLCRRKFSRCSIQEEKDMVEAFDKEFSHNEEQKIYHFHDSIYYSNAQVTEYIQ